MKESLYIRLHERVEVSPNSLLTLGNISQLITSGDYYRILKKLPVHQVTEDDKNRIVIDIMQVIAKIAVLFPSLDIQAIGPTQTVIEVHYPKRKSNVFAFIGVWFLLLIGSGLAIMNFHEDVSMREVHQHMYYIVTGEVSKKPLILQIPYSFGLGLGMVLFFNHLFKKRINEEPSPLEMEMLKYQQSLDQYTIVEERKGRLEKNESP